MHPSANVPLAITKLLVSYFCHTLDEAGRKKLDQWICENDQNMDVFEECLEESLKPVVFDPDRHSPEESLFIPLNPN